MTDSNTLTTVIPASIQKRLDELIIRLRIPMIQRLIQVRALSETERDQIGSETKARVETETEHLPAEGESPTKCRNRPIEADQRDQVDFIDLWSRSRKISTARAIVDLSLAVDVISIGEHRFLLRELGETDEPPSSDRPRWDRKLGKLWYRGKLARKVRGVKNATNLVSILDDFERLGWSEWIPTPLILGDDQTLRETVANLNQGCHGLRFRSDGSGSGVIWEVDSAAQRPRDSLRPPPPPG